MKLFEMILEENPRNSEIIVNKSVCLAELGKYEESLKELEKVLLIILMILMDYTIKQLHYMTWTNTKMR